MTPDDIIKLLDATCICGARKLHDPIQHAFAADLMSDVLRLNTEGLLLITGMANPQVIRTAEMADIPFILFVRDKQITAEMQQLAEENEILLLRCRQSMFRVSGYYGLYASQKFVYSKTKTEFINRKSNK